jgi:hypothetical protein
MRLPALRPIHGLIALLAIGLAVASLGFVRPLDCQRACDEAEGIPCTAGACRFREQRAGFPLPILVDDPGGGSPTNGWAKLGPEDPFYLASFLLDAVFYGGVVWLAWSGVRLVRGKEKPGGWLAFGLTILIIVAGLVAGWVAYRPFMGR